MLIDYLNKEFNERRRRNPRYSIRSFAKKLKIDASSLAKILKGQRAVSAALAKRLLEALDVDESLKATLLLSLHEGPQTFPSDEDFVVPAATTAGWMKHWEFYAVLSLCELPKVKTDAASLAKRLGSSKEIVEGILDCLTEHSLVERRDGRLYATGRQLTAPPDFDRAALREAHVQTIQKGIEALDRVDGEKRDISGITVATSRAKCEEACRRIKVFRRTLSKYLADGDDADCVYRLNIQFFPLA